MAAELEAMQITVKSSLRKWMPWSIAWKRWKIYFSNAKCAWIQIAELNTKLHSLSTATQVAREGNQTSADEPTASSSKAVPMPTPNPRSMLKTSPKTKTSPGHLNLYRRARGLPRSTCAQRFRWAQFCCPPQYCSPKLKIEGWIPWPLLLQS